MTYPTPEKSPHDDWFDDHYLPELGEPHNPLDDMPIAKDYDNPRPEEEIADAYSSRHESTPDFEKEGGAEEVVTMHEKMYRIATAKYNPFSIGGSENISDIQKKRSPWLGGSENFQGGSENVR